MNRRKAGVSASSVSRKTPVAPRSFNRCMPVRSRERPDHPDLADRVFTVAAHHPGEFTEARGYAIQMPSMADSRPLQKQSEWKRSLVIILLFRNRFLSGKWVR